MDEREQRAGPASDRGGFPDVSRCNAVQPSKAAIEVRKIAEADTVGDSAHRLFGEPGLAQHAMSANQTLI